MTRRRLPVLVGAIALAASCSSSTTSPDADDARSSSGGDAGVGDRVATDEPAPTTTSASGPTATSEGATAPDAPPASSATSTSVATPTTGSVVASPPPALAPTGEAPTPPADAAETAARLTAVEAEVRAGVDDLDRLTRLGHEHQTLYRALARRPDWIAVLDADARARAATIIDAGESAARSVPTPLTDAPAWTIRRPLPPGELRALYEAAEAETGTPWEALAAINLVETRMGRIVGDSSAGAQGPMQFIPPTWERYGAGGDPFVDADAIAAAGRLLADAGAPGDLAGALHAYNPSDAYVASILRYVELFEREPWTYDAFWGWQVYVITVDGLQWMPEGTVVPEPVPFAALRDELPAPVPTTPPDDEVTGADAGE